MTASKKKTAKPAKKAAAKKTVRAKSVAPARKQVAKKTVVTAIKEKAFLVKTLSDLTKDVMTLKALVSQHEHKLDLQEEELGHLNETLASLDVDNDGKILGVNKAEALGCDKLGVIRNGEVTYPTVSGT